MKTSLSTSALRRDFSEGLLDFLWRQWAHLGVSGASGAPDGWAIDPEALLIFSLHIARRDPRLFDEILDWLVVNASVVSTQRLRNLIGDEDDRVVHSALSWAYEQGAAPLRSWQKRTSAPAPLEDLFQVASRPLHVEQPDASFERFGLRRPLARRSGKSRRPDISLPANLAIRMRLFFGVGARAEIMRFLLSGNGSASTTRIADAVGYARRNVAEALGALEEAGAAHTRKYGGKEWHVDRERWAALLDLDVRELPRFTNWIRFFRALEKLDNWLGDSDSPRTDYMRTSSARQLLEDIGDDLATVDINVAGSIKATRALTELEKVVWSSLKLMSGPPDRPSPPILERPDLLVDLEKGLRPVVIEATPLESANVRQDKSHS